MTKVEILKFVDALYKMFDSKNPFHIAEQLGIKIEYRNYNQTVKGYYHRVFGKCYIVINSTYSEKAQSIICAHELGHALMHAELHSQIEARAFEFSDIGEAENQANFFAAAMLLDQDQINMRLVNMNDYLIKSILQQNFSM
jgi:Zn-dependent peptidase ImmA (M78 family)